MSLLNLGSAHPSLIRDLGLGGCRSSLGVPPTTLSKLLDLSNLWCLGTTLITDIPWLLYPESREVKGRVFFQCLMGTYKALASHHVLHSPYGPRLLSSLWCKGETEATSLQSLYPRDQTSWRMSSLNRKSFSIPKPLVPVHAAQYHSGAVTSYMCKTKIAGPRSYIWTRSWSNSLAHWSLGSTGLGL